MNRQETQLNSASVGRMVEVSVAPVVSAIAEQFSARGVAKAVVAQTREQIEKEAETRKEAPAAYRLSVMNDSAIRGIYRHGKENMSTNDLIHYFTETRAMRTRHQDFSTTAVQDDEVLAGKAEKPCRAVVRHKKEASFSQKLSALPATIKKLPANAVQYIRASLPAWFDFSPVDTTQETRRFPVSAFAAIAAVAVSLMLIVASSVMVNHGEKRVSRLTVELSELSNEVFELQSDLDVENDLLQIRDIATSEFGMVEEKYVQMQYLSLGSADSIEVFEEEKEQTVGISALLSAIGFK